MNNATFYEMINNYTKSAPVDVYSLAKDLNIIVGSDSFSNKKPELNNVLCVIFKTKNNQYCIVNNSNKSAEDQRFGVAVGIIVYNYYKDKLEKGIVFESNENLVCISNSLTEIENNDVRKRSLDLLIPSQLLLDEIIKNGSDKAGIEKITSLFSVNLKMLLKKVTYIVESNKKNS